MGKKSLVPLGMLTSMDQFWILDFRFWIAGLRLGNADFRLRLCARIIVMILLLTSLFLLPYSYFLRVTLQNQTVSGIGHHSQKVTVYH